MMDWQGIETNDGQGARSGTYTRRRCGVGNASDQAEPCQFLVQRMRHAAFLACTMRYTILSMTARLFHFRPLPV